MYRSCNFEKNDFSGNLTSFAGFVQIYSEKSDKFERLKTRCLSSDRGVAQFHQKEI